MTGGRADPNHAREEWGLNSLMAEQVVPTLKRSSSDERDGSGSIRSNPKGNC